MKLLLSICILFVCGVSNAQMGWVDTAALVGRMPLILKFKSDTTHYGCIVHREGRYLMADSGFVVKSGKGSEYIANYFPEDPIVKWFIWTKEYDNSHFYPEGGGIVYKIRPKKINGKFIYDVRK
jgi:hypothetical protein